MNLNRLARSSFISTSTQAGRREIRRLAAVNFNGLHTARVTTGLWWAIQQAAWAVEARATGNT